MKATNVSDFFFILVSIILVKLPIHGLWCSCHNRNHFAHHTICYLIQSIMAIYDIILNNVFFLYTDEVIVMPL